MTILNLGCGVKTSDRVVNIDWSIYLRLRKSKLLGTLASPLMSDARKERLAELDGKEIQVHNLAKGIAYGDSSVDAVYHSHLLEHLDRETAKVFLTEIKRVLVPGGIVRVVVPDMEQLCRRYLDHLEICLADPGAIPDHERQIARIIEQCVRKERYGSKQQRGFVRFVDRLVLGDARKQGEVHQWMYDRVSLQHILENLGYSDVKVCSWQESQIPDWNEIGLDISDDDAGKPHKKYSLYIEAKK